MSFDKMFQLDRLRQQFNTSPAQRSGFITAHNMLDLLHCAPAVDGPQEGWVVLADIAKSKGVTKVNQGFFSIQYSIQ